MTVTVKVSSRTKPTKPFYEVRRFRNVSWSAGGRGLRLSFRNLSPGAPGDHEFGVLLFGEFGVLPLRFRNGNIS